MKTGEPDMPAKTLVLATFSPDNLAMIVDWRGPAKPFRTPRISIPNSSGSLPAKTVRAVPFIPGRKSSSANRGVGRCALLIELDLCLRLRSDKGQQKKSGG